MRGLHRAAPDVDGRHDDAIGLEPVEREDSPDDVDDRVERADFVQVDLLHRHVVDGGFRFGEPIEERRRTRLSLVGQRRLRDALLDAGEVIVPMPGPLRTGTTR